MSIEQLAYANDISKATLSDLQKGLARPSISTLHRIADGLNVELLDLFVRPTSSERHRLIDRTRVLTANAIRDLAAAADQATVKKRGSTGF